MASSKIEFITPTHHEAFARTINTYAGSRPPVVLTQFRNIRGRVRQEEVPYFLRFTAVPLTVERVGNPGNVGVTFYRQERRADGNPLDPARKPIVVRLRKTSTPTSNIAEIARTMRVSPDAVNVVLQQSIAQFGSGGANMRTDMTVIKVTASTTSHGEVSPLALTQVESDLEGNRNAIWAAIVPHMPPAMRNAGLSMHSLALEKDGLVLLVRNWRP